MNRYYGTKESYSQVRSDRLYVYMCYDIQAEADGVYCTWAEERWSKKQTPIVTVDMAKQVIVASINAETDKKILEGHEWRGMKIWLSTENQFNYKAAYDLAVQSGGLSLPVTFKFGTDEEPVYHEFKTLDEFAEFYTGCVKHVSDMLAEGWKKKDSIDWEAYKEALDALYAEKEKKD